MPKYNVTLSKPDLKAGEKECFNLL